MAPATFFAISNIVGSKIQVADDSISLQFDPTMFALNQDVAKQLLSIEHMSS